MKPGRWAEHHREQWSRLWGLQGLPIDCRAGQGLPAVAPTAPARNRAARAQGRAARSRTVSPGHQYLPWDGDGTWA